MSGRSPHWPARDAELVALWAAGLSAAEIAGRLGVSRNAVIGRAYRLALPPRPAPIRRAAAAAAPAPRCLPMPRRDAAARPEVRPRASAGPVARSPGLAGGRLSSRTLAPAAGRTVAETSPPPAAFSNQHTRRRAAESLRPLVSSSACRFPLWPDDALRPPRPPRFCGLSALPGRSWCAAHARIVFVAGAAERAA
ncbi:MAG: GcrA family cell cycle regulator [Burkholderiaceae bacterium]|nr:GcrA family cell cycle regulator [Burkholderiaceae bacterium]